MRILILNGPNLNLIGLREPEIYGTISIDEIIGSLRLKFTNLSLEHYQTNHEGCIIDKLHEVGFSYDGIVLNAGGYTHTSVAIHDAIKAITTPVIEVHISDLDQREDFRKVSLIRPAAQHHIMGKGTLCYQLALEYLIQQKS